MLISLHEVEHVARLARLELDAAEMLSFQGELNALLGHFQDIEALDTSEIEPKPHAVTLSNVWAEDQPRLGLSREKALRNAPLSRAGLFVAPTIIED